MWRARRPPSLRLTPHLPAWPLGRVESADIRAHGDGEQWAERALESFATEGLRRHVHALLKQDRGVIRIGHTGAIISTPTHVGIIGRNDEGGQKEP